MKRIFLFLASVAVFASCVKENTLAPELQDGQVRISAVAADSKALLEELNVVWEETDAIALLLNGETKAEFAAESVNGANADFVGSLGVAYEDLETAYAVYPATAFNAELKVEHKLPADQTAGVTTGMLLASAKLDVEDLKDAQSTATFKSALTLLQVVVPEGVKEVALHATRDGLVGETTFNYNYETGLLTRNSVSTTSTVKLAAEAGLEAKTYPVLVYPGNADDLKLTMTATDGVVYESTVPDVKFTAGEARKIDLTKIFNVDSRELYVVLPAGETFEVPVVTTDHYQYEVSCAADWVTYEVPTRGFHKETIKFTVAENTTGDDREAEVTISWGDDRTKRFTIQQKNIFMDFVSTDENPLEWEENFGLFTSETDAKVGNNPAVTYSNVFTIELSEDYTKGTYKIKNIFKTDKIRLDSGQEMAGQGGEYYAYYADGKLTVKMAGALKSYFFNGDVVLTYDEAAKTFAADPIPFTSNSLSSFRNAGFIGGYTAAVKVDEPETSGDPIAGTWNLTSGLIGTGATNSPSISLNGKEMIISGSDGNYKIEKIGDTDYNLSLTLSDNTLVSTPAYTNAPVLTLVYDSEANTLTQSSDFMDYMSLPLSGLVATKPGGAEVAGIETGTYSGAGKYGFGNYLSSSFTDTFTITENNDDKGAYLISGMFNLYGSGGGTYYANYSDGVLTILAANSTNHEHVGGGLSSDITMTYSNGTLSMSGVATVGSCSAGEYTATKQ